MNTEKRFFNIGGLRKLMEGVPDDRTICCQVVAADGTAWNMWGDFCPQVPNGDVACIAFSHAQLKTLPDPSNASEKNLQEIISDEELVTAFGHANFGDATKREVIQNSLLKYASGYATGHTAFSICKELGLITKNEVLTTKGKRYLWEAFSAGRSI